jgi:hypothetical protein
MNQLVIELSDDLIDAFSLDYSEVVHNRDDDGAVAESPNPQSRQEFAVAAIEALLTREVRAALGRKAALAAQAASEAAAAPVSLSVS